MVGILLIGSLILVPVVIIAAVILLATKKSSENFIKKVDSIYSYIVLLAALVMLIVGLVLLITSVTDFLLPNDVVTSIKDINEKYISIIGSIGIIIVSIPVFIFHQKRIEKK